MQKSRAPFVIVTGRRSVLFMHTLGIEPIFFYNKGDRQIRDSELFQSIPFSAWGKTPSGYDWEATDAEGLSDFCHPPASFYFKMEILVLWMSHAVFCPSLFLSQCKAWRRRRRGGFRNKHCGECCSLCLLYPPTHQMNYKKSNL